MMILSFLAGLVLLVGGAEFLVRGASALASAVGVSSLVVGLTVVAFGTSTPELAVTLRSAIGGHGDLGLGNVIGSNICNVLLILGISALVTPLAVASQLIRREVPIMVGVSAAVWLMSLDGRIGRMEGIVLSVGMVVYTVLSIRLGRLESEAAAAIVADVPPPPARNRFGLWIGQIAGGLAALVVGTHLLVTAAVSFAETLGVSQLVIGLTVIAIGTSLPEVATSVVAAIRGERDIAVGNVVGSNILNLLAVLGLAGLFAPIPVAPAALNLDLPVMFAVAVACMPIFWTGARIARWEGALFLGYYIAYTAYLVLRATSHDALPAFTWAMGFFVIPLTVITILVMVARSVAHRLGRST